MIKDFTPSFAGYNYFPFGLAGYVVSLPDMKTVIHDALRQEWLEFMGPAEIFCARTPHDIMPTIRRAADFAENHNLPLVGWVSYEAAGGIDPALPGGCTNFPLAYFAAFENYRPVTLPGPSAAGPQIQWRSEISRQDYSRNFFRVKQFISDGETYQVNYTFRMRSESFNPAAAWEYWLAMIASQRCDYGAFIETDEWTICSASPELFFAMSDGEVRCRPMKGTAARGLWPSADEQAAADLAASEKNRAENLMIVDMMRNDLGRIANPGSVEATELCVVERYPTLWQMVSEIRCQSGCGWADVMAAMFPCASITGAPKRRTMQIIGDIEVSPRKIYTGTGGFVLPGGRSQFSVAIRTVLVDKAAGAAEYGVGGGVVWDSDDAGEFEESLLKARVLLQPAPRPSLLETLLWEEGGYFLLSRHIDRLAASAKYFDYPFNRESATDLLIGYARKFEAGQRYRVRMVMDESGTISLEHFEMGDAENLPVRVALATMPVDANDVLLYHKTTSRGFYERAKASRSDVDDVLLYNSQGLLTESTIANVVVKLGDKLITPDVSTGLLGGVFRQELIDCGKIEVENVPIKSLAGCEEIWLINSVRKWRKAVLV